ncbi:hypothetical protein LINPERHAP1_LOCUS4602 [Linum perenne]
MNEGVGDVHMYICDIVDVRRKSNDGDGDGVRRRRKDEDPDGDGCWVGVGGFLIAVLGMGLVVSILGNKSEPFGLGSASCLSYGWEKVSSPIPFI